MASTGLQEGQLGENGERRHDPESIRKTADDLDGLADTLDDLDESMPAQVDPGVFGPYVTDNVHTVVADVVSFILRLRAAADKLRETARRYESDEDANERDVESHLDVYEERWSR